MNEKKTKRIGIVSYNIYYKYSNYGSVLQSYAMQEALKLYTCCTPIIIDYCPDIFLKCDPYNPLNVTEHVEQIYTQQHIDLKAIAENEQKVRKFIADRYCLSHGKYTSFTFNDSLLQEKIDGYLCGSDAIWSVEYFRDFDKAFYGCYPCMQDRTIAYAASFGETVFHENLRDKMLLRMKNFKAIGLRELTEFKSIAQHTKLHVERVLDPTLLLPAEKYKTIMSERIIKEPYLLIYSRQKDKNMYNFAKKIAEEQKIAIVNISLHEDADFDCNYKYNAGIEEFLSLIYYAEIVITNSLHGTIFSVVLQKEFWTFPRINGDRKIDDFLALLNLKYRKVDDMRKTTILQQSIDYQKVTILLEKYKEKSIRYLKYALEIL